ncbi:hypothetical protein RSOLAG22IIIB_09708 [Rhizoctonia solani]|uniref:Uncharacterized protein n=1 Tax=Rhizoctonia solani TaxID=456999 RepID=A0A0K6FZQ6_9AGAM|nr:hypothetical protein RSOLAG22IIIB_09708 [Rhizoctonia solani]
MSFSYNPIDSKDMMNRDTSLLEQARCEMRKAMEERAVINNHIAFARSQNRLARDDNARLLPLRLRDGTMPYDVFPHTFSAFKDLKVEDDLECLMALYKLTTDENISWDVEEKRKLVADHISVRLPK